MSRSRKAVLNSVLLLLGIAGCTITGLGGISLGVKGYISPAAVVAGSEGKILYIAGYESRSVLVFDAVSEKVTAAIPVKGRPGGLALSPDGKKLYVTCSGPEGIVEVISLKKGRVEKTIRAGHTPCSPVAAPDGKTLYVCNRFDNTVSVINLSSGKEYRKIPMLREPVAAALTPDGKYLFVANHLPSGGRIYDYVTDGGIMMVGSYISSGYYTGTRESYAASGVVLAVDTSTCRLVEMIILPPGSIDLKGICISPDGRFVYVTHVIARYQHPTTQLERGWINTNALSIIDAAGMKLLDTVLLDDVDRGASNPWGVVCSPEGSLLCISHAGTHEVSIIDRAGLHEKLVRTGQDNPLPESSAAKRDTANDLVFLTGLRRRIGLSGNGPRALAFAGTKLFVAEYFSDTLSIFDTGSGEDQEAESVSLGAGKPMTPARRGEMYFHDAALCFQQWQSCASCHPGGRVDALNWDLLNDGIGNPKNTKNLLLSHRTPPAMSAGIRRSAEDAVRAGIRHIHFSAVSESAAEAIDAYLKSMKPVPSPFLENGRLSKSAKRGKKLFKKAGCIECHPPPLYTNLKKYNAGTGTGIEKDSEFDTPSLIEIWRTAPYLHDGRVDDLYQVLTEFNTGDMRGVTSRLDNLELYDLIEFILSL